MIICFLRNKYSFTVYSVQKKQCHILYSQNKCYGGNSFSSQCMLLHCNIGFYNRFHSTRQSTEETVKVKHFRINNMNQFKLDLKIQTKTLFNFQIYLLNFFFYFLEHCTVLISNFILSFKLSPLYEYQDYDKLKIITYST